MSCIFFIITLKFVYIPIFELKISKRIIDYKIISYSKVDYQKNTDYYERHFVLKNIKLRALIRECGTSRNVVPTVINHVIKVYSTESTWLECSDQKKPREQKTKKIGQTNLSCTFGLKEQTRIKKALGTWVPISPTIWRPDMEISCFTKFFKISLKQHSQRQQ